MNSLGLEALGQAFGIAIKTSGADFRAPGDRIPAVFCPLYAGVIRHIRIPAFTKRIVDL